MEPGFHRHGKVGSESPRETNATGHGHERELNPRGRAPDPDLEQGPEVDATQLGVVGKPATERRRQRREGTGHRRGGAARSGV